MKLPSNRTAVKVCGIIREEDAIAAIDSGADILGFNTWTGTKRYLDLEKNASWLAALPSSTLRVALLVNAPLEFAARVAAMPFIDAMQIHGDEDAAECARIAALGKPIIKALRAKDPAVASAAGQFSTRHVLLDAHVPGAYGGTGARVDVELARDFRLRNPDLIVWLAGGLRPENVGDAVRFVRPAVVDVSSGVESEVAHKDPAKMRALVDAVRAADSHR
jgi:phosphoribosylanthranilate isomerase